MRAPKAGDWDCRWAGLPFVWVHISDKTRGQAKAETVRLAREAGYRARFTEVTTRPCIAARTVWCREVRA